MVTSIDICNRALQMAEARATITALNDGTNEANNCNLIYSTIVDWCFSVTNWNFARKIDILTPSKNVPGTPGVWSSAYPAPPWKYQYLYPSDAVRIQYVMSQSLDSTGLAWLGEPAKFVVGMDTITAVQRRVILTNVASALCQYTATISDPTQWPAYFSQAVVSVLSWLLASALSGNKDLSKFLEQVSEQHMLFAVSLNRNEGLLVEDTTPEWILSRGLPFPLRRQELIHQPQQQEPQRDDRR
jgi:hypothetical protein